MPRFLVALGSITVAAFLSHGCRAGGNEIQTWSNSTGAGEAFRVRDGAETIALPAERDAFLSYMTEQGASHYDAGSDRTNSVPQPLPKSPCSPASSGMVFVFPLQGDGVQPRYVAYVDREMVTCVDKQFSQPAP